MNPGEENPLVEAAKTFMEVLIKEIYTDLKAWAISGISKSYSFVKKKVKHKTYSDFQELRADIATGKVSNGDYISIECKISPFGPNLKPIYIGPLSGMNTQNRLGPPLIHPNPAMEMVVQAMSNLKPVSIYPPISDSITQVRLYPKNGNSVGFFSMMPEVNSIVPSMNALVTSEMLNSAHENSKLTGRLRCISQQDFIDAGYSLEEYEVVRSVKDIWFFDAAHEDADLQLLNTEEIQFWGALYSAGHMEINGNLPVNKLVNGYLQRLSPLVQDLQVVQNQAKNMEINILGKGFRMVQHIKAPIYALHFDINLSEGYREYKDSYDKILKEILINIRDTCKDNSVELANPLDLDFNYTSKPSDYRLLESNAAKLIDEPLAIAIREWNKKYKY